MSFATYEDAKTAIDLNILNDLINQRGSAGALQSMLDTNKNNFLNGVQQNKFANAGLVFNGVEKSLTNQLNTYSYYTRNKDVNSLINYPMARMRTDAQGLIADNANSQRQYEINQWTSGNRSDTLFVYQIIFVLVLAISILTGIWRMGYISTGLLSFAVFGSVVAIVLIIVARAQYTAFQRNKRYWNKRQFPRLGLSASSASINCPSADSLLAEFDIDRLKDRMRSGTAEYRGAAADFLKNKGNDLANLLA